MKNQKTVIENAHYTLNSDNKVELHFEDRQSYQNLPNEVKQAIKRGFMWGRMRGCWVSRSKGGYVPYSMQGYEIPYKGADQLKSFEDAQEQKATRASNKADRFRTYAENATKRAENLQAEFNRLRKDWSWLTQPNVNTSGGRSFTNSRNRVMNRFEKGFEEYRKAGDMDAYAQQLEVTAEQNELKDLGYLQNRIKENKKIVKNFPDFEKNYTEKMKSEIADNVLMWLDGQMNRYRLAFDKIEYFTYYYDLRVAELKETGSFFNEEEAKKTIKKEFKAFLLEYYGIKLLEMSIAYTVKSGTCYYYRTDKPLPEMFQNNWAADNAAKKKTREIVALMEKVKNSKQTQSA